MVLVIVTRNIDLSVGSMLGFVGMVMGVIQATLLPQLLGFEHPATWILTLAAGLFLGVLLGAFQGFVIAYLGIPSFIVTLGGLLVWRGGAWWVTHGQTVAPLDSRFRLMGGGTEGSIGAAWSWVVAVIACAAVIILLAQSRARRMKFHFPLRPMVAEIFLGGMACAVILAAVAIFNAYPWPIGSVRRYALANHIRASRGRPLYRPRDRGAGSDRDRCRRCGDVPGDAHALWPLHLRDRRQPEAAELAGVNTRWVIMKVFMLMGLLTAISGAISIARLDAATNSEGVLAELLVIAAAVIGGTSLSGGVGTVAGAMLGAVLMQSLQSGMVLLGVDTPLQNIVVGAILVLAVGLDTVYRRRTQ